MNFKKNKQSKNLIFETRDIPEITQDMERLHIAIIVTL